MKGHFAAAVAVMAGGAAANHRHAHELFAKRGHELDLCTTVWSTITGEPTLCPPAPTSIVSNTTTAIPAPVTTSTTSTSIVVETTTSVAPVPTTTSVVIPLPTPEPHTCPTPGTYTFTATTITVDQTTTVCAATSTQVPPGTHTVGGITTIVETATTVTCPVATVITSGTDVTSTIVSTEFVCPTPGTYTVGPHVTTVTEDTTIVYPVPTTVVPGTYTQPEQVVTVTETDFVYYCPYSSVGLPTTTAKPVPAPVPTTSVVVAAPTTKKETPKPQPTKPAGGSSDSVGGDTDHWGVTYNPYNRDNGNCLTKDEVEEDVKALAADGFKILRTYSTDCDTLEHVGAACEANGLDMIVGIFITATGCSYDAPDIKEQVDAIADWANWDIVKLFVVGNEALMNDFCSAEELGELINTVKEKCSGYTGPFTTAETLNIWQTPGVPEALCDAIDITGANIHAYFNPETTADKAGDFVASQLDLLKEICSGKDVVNLECGWPTRGKCNGVACPSVENQAEAISSIRKKAGSNTIFFSAWDESWKGEGDCGCETSWGAKDCFSS